MGEGPRPHIPLLLARHSTFNVYVRYAAGPRFATCLINEVKGINGVVYDVTSKPLGTIEWE